MHLLSTGKQTVLSDFVDLETKSIFPHSHGESTDFQFSAQRRVFVEVDRKAGLAVMRIKEKPGKEPELQRLRKLTIDNVFCVACAKQTAEEMAVGQTNGNVKLYNYRSGQLVNRFQSNKERSTVLFLDYNSTDEYIAAVREGGEVSIYGTKTNSKMHTLTFDGNTTLARFHPSKRFQLASASHKGAVCVYDIVSKKQIFGIDDAHDAPCRDLSMCLGQPALLVSVGYDCHINIFDIRRQAQSSSGRLTYNHPLSTVSLSECGTYFCAGNLKGELIAYDMRSTKSPLAVRRVHESAVGRIAFVPMPVSEEPISTSSSSFNSLANLTVENGSGGDIKAVPPTTKNDGLRKSIAVNLLSTQQQLENMSSSLGYGSSFAASSKAPRDSFYDFLDAQGHRSIERMSTRFPQHRDSFDWESLNRRSSQEEKGLGQVLSQTLSSNLCSMDSANSTSTDCYDVKLQQTLSNPLRDRSNISGDMKLKQIVESDEQKESQDQLNDCSATSSYTSSDKENPLQGDQELKRRLHLLPASRNSTPNHIVPTAPQHSLNPELKPQQLMTQSSAEVAPSAQPVQGDCKGCVEVRKDLEALQELVIKGFAKISQDAQYVADQTKWSICAEVANYWNLQLDSTHEIKDALALLLRSDRFMHEYSRLQLENCMLKKELQDLKQNLDNRKENGH